MYSLKNIMTAMLLLFSGLSHSQIKNPITENIKIYGSCAICKTNIEKVGNLKNTSTVIWDKNTQIASITYDSKKTNTDQILKRIALASYDSSTFLAPQSVYAKLPECCQYVREAKQTETKSDLNTILHNAPIEIAQAGLLQRVYVAYFDLKDAFVQSNNAAVSANAKVFQEAIFSVKIESLSSEESKIWVKVNEVLTIKSKEIATAKDIDKQRECFNELSKNLYELLKITKVGATVYYQYCPMKNANWLSKESAVKNPYYGAQMLSCGNTVEVIQ